MVANEVVGSIEAKYNIARCSDCTTTTIVYIVANEVVGSIEAKYNIAICCDCTTIVC